MLVATTNDLTGHRIVRHLGVVRGVTAVSYTHLTLPTILLV